MKQLRYLITGTGRCGTVYMAKAFTASGIRCTHEGFFDERGLDHALSCLRGDILPGLSFCSTNKSVNGEWIEIEKYLEHPFYAVAEASYMAAPFLKNDALAETKIIHLVRHPNKVVKSFVSHLGFFKDKEPSNKYEKFIWQYVPELQSPMSMFDRAALYYILWNEMIEVNNVVFHKIEGRLSDLELGLVELEDKEINSINKTKHEFNVGLIESKEIKSRFVAMGKRYGYNMAMYLL